MKIPKNLTEEETLETINYIISKIAPKYTFHGFELDDLKQESFIICVDALERYDNNRPLENFLAVNLSNRLKNLIRDNHASGKNEVKKNIYSPSQIPNENYIEDNRNEDDFIVFYRDICNVIDEKLPHDMREDYLKIVHGAYVPKHKKEQIISFIKELIE